MRQECIEAVSQALGGRKLTKAESTNIENRILTAMRKMAAEDIDGWRQMTLADRLEAAAGRAARQVSDEAALKQRRVALSALRHEAVKTYLDGEATKAQLAGKPRDDIDALSRMLVFYGDGKSATLSVESNAAAIRDEAVGAALEVFDVTRGKVLGLFTNQAGVVDLFRELRGQRTGNAEARAAAESYQRVSEGLRQRFNRAGGKIGRLEDWGMPQSHSAALALRAGRDKWVGDHMALVDRQRYANEDGTLMNDGEMRGFLSSVFQTITTDGANAIQPGQVTGMSMKANANAAARELHYRDADAYLMAQQRYSDTPMLQTMIGHIDKMARDIALVEALGPNPNLMFKYWADTAHKEMALLGQFSTGEITKNLAKLQTKYVEVSGTKKPAASAVLAEGFDTYRALNVAARLGSSAITAVTDIGTQALTAVYNGLPITQVFMNELRALNPANAADRREALRAGLGVQQFIGAVNRWGTDGLAQDAQVSSKIGRWAQGAAAGVMKVSGINALTGAGQQAFGSVLMDSIGSITRGGADLAALAAGKDAHARLARRLRDAGVSDDMFAIWRLAQPEDWRNMGDTVLTSASIYRVGDDVLAGIAERAGTTPRRLRDQAATSLMAFVQGETSMAIIEPGARERAALYGSFNQQRGTLSAETWRSFLQFKSFPIAMIMRHGARAMAQDGAVGKGAYIAALVGLTTVMGGLAVQLNEVASGRDPNDMTDPRFVGKAFMKGGALGLYADFLFADYTKFGSSIGASLGGPVYSDTEDLLKLVMGSAQKSLDGKKADPGAAAIKMLKGKVPGANLWYTKAATDRLIFNQLQEMASPGYLGRMESRARKNFDQSYYWRPSGELRAPDLGAAVGE